MNVFLLLFLAIVSCLLFSCKAPIDPDATVCVEYCDKANCVFHFDSQPRSFDIKLSFQTPDGVKEYSGNGSFLIPVSVAESYTAIKVRAVFEGTAFDKKSILEKTIDESNVYDCGTMGSGCRKYKNCGCSGKSKSDCSGGCCVWTTGSGCGCR